MYSVLYLGVCYYTLNLKTLLVLFLDLIAFMVFYTAASGGKIDPMLKIGYIIQLLSCNI